MRDEAKKTMTFVLVAGMAVLVAWEPWRPAPLDTSAPPEMGQKLFPDFTNPLAAKSLEIVKFNEDTASIRDFQVDQVNGVWSIPSHSNYPADAQQHMADAATLLMDLTILGMASDHPGDQRTFGVVTPDPAKLKVGMTGVGTRVTVKNSKDKVLADLVIGKQVKDLVGQYYVRRADRDQIFTVRLSPDKLSTKFGDWIEKDLLKLNAFDVRDVVLNDYSSQAGISPEGRPVLEIDNRNLIKLEFDDAKSQWKLEELAEYDQNREPQPIEAPADEELNTQKLNDLKTALDDLQIVDVERKPSGLSADLGASEEFLNNVEAMQSLAERGFIAVPVKPGGPREIFSSEGEVTCTTKEGVRYVLRFGNLAGTSLPEDNAEGSEPESSGPSRYLFVTAQFDESQIAKPEMLPLPGETADEAKPTDEVDEKKPAEEKSAGEAVEEKPSEDAAEEKPAEETSEEKPAEEKAAAAPETKTADLENPPADDVAPGEKADEPSDAKTDAKADAAAEEKPADDAAKPDAQAEKPQEPATPEEAERLAVERENKRRQDEYEAAVKAGKDKVKELNERFADWYYIISDDTYKKIHLGRNEVFKKKDAEGDNALDALDLENLEDGIKIGPGALDAPQ